MSNALAKQNPQRSIHERIETGAPQFKKALPGHIPVEKFVRTVQTAVSMSTDIEDACNTAGGVKSLMTACTKAATDGLILDGREAALVTFNTNIGSKQSPRWEKHVQYIPMVAGLMKKARNSGEIANIAAHLVFEKDRFEYVLGDEERIEHVPRFGDRGKPVAVYAIARLKDGTVQREVMDETAIMAIAAQSKNAHQYDPKKGRNYGEWWRKTAIRRISKYLPSSSDRDEFMNAVARMDEDFDYAAAHSPDEPDQIDQTDQTGQPGQPATKKRGAGAAAFAHQTTDSKGDAEQAAAEDSDIIDIDADYVEITDEEKDEAGKRAKTTAPTADDDI